MLFLKETWEPFDFCIKAQYKRLGAYLEPCADLAIKGYTTLGKEGSARHQQPDHVLIKLGPTLYLCIFGIPDYMR